MKEIETISRKKESFFLNFLSGILFFVVYSGIILREHTFLRDICVISCLTSILLVSSLKAYTEEEGGIITDLENARELIESIEGESEKFNDRKANALVSLFRSRKNEMGWRKVSDILEDYDYDEAILWNDVARIHERKRQWEKQ